jgi:hypothetical protein
MTFTIDEAQTKAAKVVGLVYRLALVPAVFAEFYVSSQFMVSGNAAQTALNIMANGSFVWALPAISPSSRWMWSITALYVVLKSVHRNLALLAAFLKP